MGKVYTQYYGLLDYQEARALQNEYYQKIKDGALAAALLGMEHPLVITKGRQAQDANIKTAVLKQQNNPPPIIATDRGGDVTLHAPGQLVAYPLVNLKIYGLKISDFLRLLEENLIKLLAQYGVKAQQKQNYTGVWVGEKKSASIGIGVKKWITYHGLAININNDLNLFDLIVPCGIKNVQMTSVTALTHINNYNLEDFFKLFLDLVSKDFSLHGQA
jgi:lipoate-protein ligase B